MKYKPFTPEELEKMRRESGESKNKMIHYELAKKYGNAHFPVPPVCTAYWDFNSWCKHYEANNVEPLNAD